MALYYASIILYVKLDLVCVHYFIIKPICEKPFHFFSILLNVRVLYIFVFCFFFFGIDKNRT